MILSIFLGCLFSKNKDSAIDCNEAPTYTEWAHGFFRGKCQSCHASTAPNRHGAPDHVTFDTYQQIEPWLDAIEWTVFEQSSMPPSGGVTEEEAILLMQWLACPY